MNTMDLNKKTNRHENVKSSFQRFMILMAVIVSTALVGCDTVNDPDDDKGGGSSTTLNAYEKKLVGTWRYENIFNSNSPRENYVFTDKGKFFFYYGAYNNMSLAGDVKSGNFKATADKITFTNIEHTINGEKKNYPHTQEAEYKMELSPIALGGNQEYLNICSLAYADLSLLPYKWYGSFKKIE